VPSPPVDPSRPAATARTRTAPIPRGVAS
jgi:hypothetical protein